MNYEKGHLTPYLYLTDNQKKIQTSINLRDIYT